MNLRWIAALIAFTLVGCVSALREPLLIEEITDVVPGETGEQDSAGMLFDEGLRKFALRPDRDSVEQARVLFLRAAVIDEQGTDALLEAARTTAWIIENERDAGRRQELSIEGVQIAQRCQLRDPSRSNCSYRLALAVGQQAREKPSTAADGLDVMVTLLADLLDNDPSLDFAGPDRVLALLLLRAPGWPSGPGDPETGLVHARRAVAAFPEYPPNQLVLGEALIEEGRIDDGREAFESAFALASQETIEREPDAPEWRREALHFLKESQP